VAKYTIDAAHVQADGKRGRKGFFDRLPITSPVFVRWQCAQPYLRGRFGGSASEDFHGDFAQSINCEEREVAARN
jgi:hypothetical protein